MDCLFLLRREGGHIPQHAQCGPCLNQRESWTSGMGSHYQALCHATGVSCIASHPSTKHAWAMGTDARPCHVPCLQELSGKVHVAALHLIAIGDRQGAAAVYRRAAMMSEAEAVL